MFKRLYFTHSLFLCSVFFTLIIILITLIPFLVKIHNAPKDTSYSLIPNGILVGDYYADLAHIRQGFTSLLVIDQYTTESLKPDSIHLFYTLVGRIGGFFHLSPISIYYICVYSSMAFLFTFIYLLVKLIIPKTYQLYCLFLIYFASPFPSYTVSFLGNSFNIGDSWWINQNIYNRFLMRPIHLIGVTVLLACTYFFIKFYHSKKIIYCFFCGILSFIGIICSTIPEIIFLSAIAFVFLYSLFFYLKTKLPVYLLYLKGIAIIFLISIPALVFIFYQTSTSYIGSIASKWEFITFQKEIYPTTIGVYIISFALLIPFILLSIPNVFKKRQFNSLFILLITSIPFVFYILSVLGIVHINKMRFLYSDPYVFGSLLGTLGIITLLSFIHSLKIKKFLWSLILILFLSNSLLALKSYWWNDLFKQDYYYNIYIPKKYFMLFDYINGSLPKYSKIMTGFGTGTFLPSFTDTIVFIGHETSTINYSLKSQISQDIFHQKYLLEDVKDIFKTHSIAYLLWEDTIEPNRYLPILRKIFQNENVTLYKII